MEKSFDTIVSEKRQKIIKATDPMYNTNYNTYNYYNRFKVPMSDPFASNIAYVFFTKPDCNINDNIAYSNFLTSLDSSESYGQIILSSVSSSYSKNKLTKSKFLNLLSNSVNNFETKDTTLKTNDVYDDFVGFRMNLPENIIESFTPDTITFSFNEYDDLRITNLIKVWVEYISNVKRGIFVPTESNRSKKILDYVSSIYFFLCGPDGCSIKYYCKLTGVYPTVIPYSSFAWDSSNGSNVTKLNVTFQYQIKEDLEPDILSDFMKISGNSTLKNNTFSALSNNYSDNWAANAVISGNKIYFV